MADETGHQDSSSTEAMPTEAVPTEAMSADLWTTLQHVSEWIRFADTKAAGVLTVDGILATVLVSAFSQNDLSRRAGIYLPLGVCAVSVVASAVLCLLCLLPRLTVDAAGKSVYFVRIAAFGTGADYYAHLRQVMAAQRFDQELAAEIWLRSRAARAKYRYVQWALLTLGIALAAAAAVGVAAVVLS